MYIFVHAYLIDNYKNMSKNWLATKFLILYINTDILTQWHEKAVSIRKKKTTLINN